MQYNQEYMFNNYRKLIPVENLSAKIKKITQFIPENAVMELSKTLSIKKTYKLFIARTQKIDIFMK